MKKIVPSLLFAFCATLFFSACSTLGITGPKMDAPEAKDAIVETMRKNIDFDKWKPYRVMWMEGEALSNKLQVLSLEMVNREGDCFIQSFVLAGPGAGNISELRKAIGISDKIDFNAVQGITPEVIEGIDIQKQYEDAKAMLPQGFTFRSINNYDINEALPSGNEFLDRNKTFYEIEAEFSMNVTEDGKEYIESAGKKSLQYYEVEFNVLPDGSVEMDE